MNSIIDLKFALSLTGLALLCLILILAMRASIKGLAPKGLTALISVIFVGTEALHQARLESEMTMLGWVYFVAAIIALCATATTFYLHIRSGTPILGATESRLKPGKRLLGD